MKTVYKYTVPVIGSAEIEVPHSAVFLPYTEMVPGIESDYDHALWVWAEVETPRSSGPQRARTFRLCVHGTGHPIGDQEQYIGTARDGVFVWHAYFEVT